MKPFTIIIFIILAIGSFSSYTAFKMAQEFQKAINEREATPSAYYNAGAWAQEYPEIKMALCEALEDDKLTVPTLAEVIAAPPAENGETVVYDADWSEDSRRPLVQMVEEMKEWDDPIAPNQPFEGICLRIDKNPIHIFKDKTFDFKVVEGIIKETEIDPEDNA